MTRIFGRKCPPKAAVYHTDIRNTITITVMGAKY
jgi:hypothetical protein